MNEKLLSLWAKIVEHKTVVIQVGGILAGALIGAAVATMIANAQQDLLLEEILMEQHQSDSVGSTE